MAFYLQPVEPTEQHPHYEYEVALGEKVFRLFIDWIERTGRWYLSVETAEGVRLLSRKKLVVAYPILQRHRKSEVWPAGEILLIDDSDSGEECGYEDLGRRCKLVWLPEEEFPAEEPAGIVIS